MNVVVIDNNIEQLDYLTAVVRTVYPTCSVCAFKDPMLAVKHVYNNDVDFVLSEVKTRPVSGFDVLRNLHRIRPEMIVILLSEDEGSRSKASEFGADGFVVKPVMKETLESMMKSLQDSNPNH